MNIPLTPDELIAAINEAPGDRGECYTVANLETSDTLIARAQVQKVVDEHEKAVSGPCPDLVKKESGECDYETDESCADCKSRRFWVALKAEGGG